MANKDVLFIGEIAEKLRCSVKTIRRRIQDGSFPLTPLPGIDAAYRWSAADVQRWLDNPSTRIRLRRRA